MARKSRQSFLKRLKEVRRMEKAALKRERRLARKHGTDLPEDGADGGEGAENSGEPRPTLIIPPAPPETP